MSGTETGKTLIVGAGITGIETACRLAAHGIASVVVEKSTEPGGWAARLPELKQQITHTIQRANQTTLVTLLTETRVKQIRGVYPHFRATLQNRSGDTPISVQNIVITVGIETEFPEVYSDIESVPGVFTYPEFATMERIPDVVRKSGRAVIVAGYSTAAPPFSLRCAFQYALRLRCNTDMQVVFIADMMRFDASGTADLFRECREAQVLFIRSNAPPEFFMQSDHLYFSTRDPGLSTSDQPFRIQGKVDLVILEPVYKPVTLPGVFWSPHAPKTDPAGYYHFGNLHYHPTGTGRTGVYLAGAVQGLKSIKHCLQDAVRVVSEICLQREMRLERYYSVDENACAACLNCVRICPHGAVTIDNTAQIAPEACRGCGICAAECPAQAIQLAEMPETYPEIETAPPVRGKISLFCCEGSTGNPVRRLMGSHSEFMKKFTVIHVPCSGFIGTLLLLEHLQKGAAAIFIAACHIDNCRHLSGNIRAEHHVRRAKKMLKELGMDSNRIHIAHFAAQMDRELLRALEQFAGTFTASFPGNPNENQRVSRHF